MQTVHAYSKNISPKLVSHHFLLRIPKGFYCSQTGIFCNWSPSSPEKYFLILANSCLKMIVSVSSFPFYKERPPFSSEESEVLLIHHGMVGGTLEWTLGSQIFSLSSQMLFLWMQYLESFLTLISFHL